MLRHIDGGFSLVEILVTLAIVGVLAAIAVPAYQNHVARSQVAEGLALTRNLRDVAAAIFMETGRFPTSNAAAGLGPGTSYRGKYVSSVELSQVISMDELHGAIIVTFGGQAVPALQGRTLALHAVRFHNGAINWACGNRMVATDTGGVMVSGGALDNVDRRFRPRECRE